MGKTVDKGRTDMKTGRPKLITAAERRSALAARNSFIYDQGLVRFGMKEWFKIVFWRKDFLTLQQEGREHYYDHHYNALILNPDRKNDRSLHSCRVVTTDLSRSSDYQDGHFVISQPVTYVGDSKRREYARLIFGFGIDLDEPKVENLFQDIRDGRFLQPSFIVSSGNGLHLYYLFFKPIPAFNKYVRLLSRLKRALTNRVWNERTSFTPLEERQFEGIWQGFRLPDTQTKFSYGEPGSDTYAVVSGFRWEKVRYYKFSELNRFATMSKEFMINRSLSADEVRQLEDLAYNPTGRTLEEAAEKWPDWYERKVIRKEPPKHWTNHPGLYDWFLRVLKEGTDVKVGHRYYCILTLAVFAKKCGIPFAQLKADAESLRDQFEALTNDENNHFTKRDVRLALKAYTKDKSIRYHRGTLSHLSGIPMKENKRNRRKRSEHVKIMTYIRDNIEYPDGNWRDGNGRPAGSPNKEHPKAEAVLLWRLNHPDSTNKAQCARDLGISRPTVTKWWNYESPDLLTVDEVKEIYADQERQFQEWLQEKKRQEQETTDAEIEVAWEELEPNWWYEEDEGLFGEDELNEENM